MGLDMYLSKRTYVKNWDHNPPERKVVVKVLKGGKPHPAIKPARVSTIVEEVAYWRKANAIHGWFVREVQKGIDECQESYVEKAKLRELVEACETILQKSTVGWVDDWKVLAEHLLPSTPGFFFGSTEYNEYFLEDLRETVKQLKPLFDEVDADHDGYYYRASW